MQVQAVAIIIIGALASVITIYAARWAAKKKNAEAVDLILKFAPIAFMIGEAVVKVIPTEIDDTILDESKEIVDDMKRAKRESLARKVEAANNALNDLVGGPLSQKQKIAARHAFASLSRQHKEVRALGLKKLPVLLA